MLGRFRQGPLFPIVVFSAHRPPICHQIAGEGRVGRCVSGKPSDHITKSLNSAFSSLHFIFLRTCTSTPALRTRPPPTRKPLNSHRQPRSEPSNNSFSTFSHLPSSHHHVHAARCSDCCPPGGRCPHCPPRLYDLVCSPYVPRRHGEEDEDGCLPWMERSGRRHCDNRRHDGWMEMEMESGTTHAIRDAIRMQAELMMENMMSDTTKARRNADIPSFCRRSCSAPEQAHSRDQVPVG